MLCISNKEIIKDTLSSLCYLTEMSDAALETSASFIDISQVAICLKFPEFEIQRLALRLIGNICSGPTYLVDKVIEKDTLPIIAKILNEYKQEGILREACILCGNIAVGASRHVNQLLDAGIIKILNNILSNPSYGSNVISIILNNQVRQEAIVGIHNAFKSGTNQGQKTMINEGLIDAMVKALESNDTQIISISVKILDHIMELNKEGDDSLIVSFISLGGQENLEKLSNFPNSLLTKKIEIFTKKYLSGLEIKQELEKVK